MQDSTVIELYSAADSAEAYTVKNLLEQQEISARVVGDWMQTCLGDVPLGLATSPRVWVSRQDAVRAKLVLADFFAARRQPSAGVVDSPALTAWTCPCCGEEVAANFDICWNCEYDRVTQIRANG